MSYCHDYNMEQCNAQDALRSLTRAHNSVYQSLLGVQSLTDLKANNYEVIDICRNITEALSKNLEDYSKCSESNYYQKSFREEVRGFIRFHFEGVDRTNLVLDLYGHYRSRISSTQAGIIRGYINDIKEHHREECEFVVECQDILQSYQD